MNTTELIAQVRKDVFIGDTVFPDYDDDAVLRELNRTLRTTFARAIVNSRQGYWQQTSYQVVQPGTANYRIPARAFAGGLEQVALCEQTAMVNGRVDGQFIKIQQVTETHAQDWEKAPSALGYPVKYVVRGDWVYLLPTPSQQFTLRMIYYMRPSQLIATSATGLIIQANTATSEIEVDTVVPNTTTTSTLFPFGPNLDIVHPSGWFAAEQVDLAQVANYSAPNYTVEAQFRGDATTDGIDYSRIVAGDYVRLADTTDWPPLPEDYHGTLAKLTAVSIMTQLNILDKKAVTEQAAGIEFERFIDSLKPRVKAEAEVLKAPRSVLQVGRSQRGFWGWKG